MAVLSLLAIFICATSPLLLTVADALPVVSLTTDCSQLAAKQQLLVRHQQQALSLRQCRVLSSPRKAEYSTSLNSVAIRRRHHHSHCHLDHQHKSLLHTHLDVAETIAGIKKATKAGAVVTKATEERHGHFRPKLDQQHRDFVAMAARVSGRSSKSVEKVLLKQLKQEYEAREQEQLEMLEPQTSLRDGGGLRVEQDNNELDPMAKTTLQILLNPKGKDHSMPVKEHIAKHNEPDEGDNNDNSDNRLILKHTKMTCSTSHHRHLTLDDSRSSNIEGHHRQQQHALKVIDRNPLNCLNNNRCTLETRLNLKTTPTIFYVPHQDDDALAMALGRFTQCAFMMIGN